MPDIGAIEPAALKARLDRGDRIFILDVREPFEISRRALPRREPHPDGRYPVAPDRARPGPRDCRRMPSRRPQRAGRDVPGAAGLRACAQSVRRNRRVVRGRRSDNSALLTGCSSRNNAEWKPRDDLSRSRNPDERRSRQTGEPRARRAPRPRREPRAVRTSSRCPRSSTGAASVTSRPPRPKRSTVNRSR